LPALEEARNNASMGLGILSHTILEKLERFPAELDETQHREVRRLLCRSAGQIQAFLHDVFDHLLAADPRGLGDTGVYFFRGLPQDVDEAEWLRTAVQDLEVYLDETEKPRTELLTAVREQVDDERRLPLAGPWAATLSFLARLEEELVPRLKEVLTRRSIRVDEMEMVERYAGEVSTACRTLRELYDAAREALDLSAAIQHREDGLLAPLEGVFARRIAGSMRELDQRLRDLVAFVPLWRKGIEKRRVLLFSRLRRDDSGVSGPGRDRRRSEPAKDAPG
jgi:hypothetical protein